VGGGFILGSWETAGVRKNPSKLYKLMCSDPSSGCNRVYYITFDFQWKDQYSHTL